MQKKKTKKKNPKHKEWVKKATGVVGDMATVTNWLLSLPDCLNLGLKNNHLVIRN